MCRNMSLVFLVFFFSVVTVLESKPLQIEDIFGQSQVADNITRTRRASDMVFPDDDDDAAEPFLILPPIHGRPECAEGSTFCEHFEHYPRHQLKNILSRHAIGKEIFGMDESPDEVITRDGSDDTYVCGSIDNTIFPKLAVNKNNKWKFIVNQEEDGYVQGVRIELCRSFGRPCDVIGNTPAGLVTSCKQKYIFRRLLSLTEKGTPVQDTFKLPSACCCTYRRSYAFLADFGKKITRA